MIGVDTPYSCSDTDSDGFENFVSFLSTSEVANGSAVDDNVPQLSSTEEEASKSVRLSSSGITSEAVGEEKATAERPTATGNPGDLEAGTQTPSTKPDPFLIKAFQDADTDGDGYLSREELKVS